MPIKTYSETVDVSTANDDCTRFFAFAKLVQYAFFILAYSLNALFCFFNNSND